MAEEAKKSKRVLEIEWMKAIAIVAMVFVHVFEMSMDNLDLTSKVPYALAQIIEFLGSVPSAVVFMFAMGFGVAFSMTTPKASLTRVLSLCGLGLFVNLFQHLVPCMMDPESFGALSENLFKIIGVDIYAFAVLATLYSTAIVCIPAIRSAETGMLVSAAVIALAFCINIAFGFETFTTGNNWGDTLIGLFIRENEWSYFPFISWIVFPITGFCSGYYYKKLNDHKKYVLIFLAVGSALLLLGIWLMRILGMDMKVLFLPFGTNYGFYYTMHPAYAVTAHGMIAIEFVLVALVVKLAKNTIPSFMKEMSKNVMDIYVIQWVFIGLLSALLARLESIYVNITIALTILIASFFASRMVEKIRKNGKLIKESGKAWPF